MVDLKKEEIKMKETKKALWEKYGKVNSQIEKLDVKDEDYKWLIERIDKTMSDIVKLEQIESENKRERNRNIAQYVTLGVTTVSGLFVVLASFEFDKTSTLTSTVGKSSVSNFISKLLFKR